MKLVSIILLHFRKFHFSPEKGSKYQCVMKKVRVGSIKTRRKSLNRGRGRGTRSIGIHGREERELKFLDNDGKKRNLL